MELPHKSIPSSSDLYETYNFSEPDVRHVMQQCGVEFDVAMKSLVKNRGDLLGAILKLSEPQSDSDFMAIILKTFEHTNTKNKNKNEIFKETTTKYEKYEYDDGVVELDLDFNK